MPLDGHSYLVSQGWTGSGTGLRQGAISRPLAIPQKKTLAGLGKDRDEAFPFWDHLFSAASKSIQIKISTDDSDDSDSEPSASVSLKRTSTGILSNRRPVAGPPADSGATTPEIDDTSPRLSLLATAKRAAAKRVLYSRFFRGPVLGPDSAFEPVAIAVPAAAQVASDGIADDVEEKPKKKKRKLLDVEKEERRERKRLKKEKKELKEKKRAEKSREKSRGKEAEREVIDAASNPDPEIKEKKRKREEDAETEADAVEAKSKRKPKEEKESKADKKRRREKQEEEESSQVESEEQRKRKRKRPVE
ncbi:hypothetical protein K438DRAFT_1860668 [Mycena galopus ATCC 62051]|nr:hypothetical protein K438DRAFT_1860668 [Mycena galopus ATCC 62051]